MTTADVLQRLDGVQGGDGQWTARCPAHDDQRASLSITAGPDGRTLIRCHAGCTAPSIVAAAGLSMADLFADGGHSNGHSNCHVNGRGRKIIATYDYCDASGKLLYQVVRYDPKDFRQSRPDGNGGWIWNIKGVSPLLYRLPGLVQSADHDRIVYVAEGEKDADRLAELGLVATTNSGGAKKWQKEHSTQLKGRRVVILPDNDTIGEEHATIVAGSLAGLARSVKVIRLAPRDGP